MNELPEVLHPYRELMYRAIEERILGEQKKLWLQIDTFLYFAYADTNVDSTGYSRSDMAENIADQKLRKVVCDKLAMVSQLSAELQLAYDTIWGLTND